MFKFFLQTFFCFFGIAHGLTSCDYQILRGYIIDEIEAGDRIQPTFVRLAFHDCVSDSCDGCLNMDTHPDNPNAGLQPAIDAIVRVKVMAEAANILVSYADLFALAGVVGSEYGMVGMPGNVNTVKGQDFTSPFNFHSGRLDCPTAPYSPLIDNFPSPHMTHAAILDFFDLEFGFEKEEVVALMGAHSLGRCQGDNSGYRGPWLPGKDSSTLDNKYFIQMINTDFSYNFRNAAGPKAKAENARPQYDCEESDGSDCGIMLNSDFEMFFDLQLDDDFHSTCEPRDCAQASTYSTAAGFAEDNQVFLDAYVPVFEKMISRGYADGDLNPVF